MIEQQGCDMPATWGFGNAGIEPGTMSGWGYLGNLDLFEGVFQSETANPQYTAETDEPGYKATTQREQYTAEDLE